MRRAEQNCGSVDFTVFLSGAPQIENTTRRKSGTIDINLIHISSSFKN
jgi:hypothetical protein